MLKTLVAAVAVVALLCTLAAPAPAQDAAKKQAEAPAKAMEKLEKSKSEMAPLMSISCGPDCGFSISTRDETELVGFVQEHVKTHHEKEISAEDIKKMATMEGEKK